MSPQKEEFHDRVARALGATRSLRIGSATLGTPLDWLALRQEVGTRLQSTGGRPTDPAWEITRSIRFDREHWQMLESISGALSESGSGASPGQVAAILLEKAIEEAALRLEQEKRPSR